MSDNEEEKQNEIEVGVGGNSLVKKVGSHKYQLQVFTTKQIIGNIDF